MRIPPFFLNRIDIEAPGPSFLRLTIAWPQHWPPNANPYRILIRCLQMFISSTRTILIVSLMITFHPHRPSLRPPWLVLSVTGNFLRRVCWKDFSNRCIKSPGYRKMCLGHLEMVLTDDPFIIIVNSNLPPYIRSEIILTKELVMPLTRHRPLFSPSWLGRICGCTFVIDHSWASC